MSLKGRIGAWVVAASARLFGEDAIKIEEPTSTTALTHVAPDATHDATRAVGQMQASATSIAGRRVSFDRPEDQYANNLAIFSQVSGDTYWRGMKLDTRTLDRVPVSKLIELLVDVSPEISSGLWHTILMCNPGFEIKAVRPGTDTPDKRGTDALLAMLDVLKTNHGAADVVFNRLTISLFCRGSICSELVIADNARDFVDLATPDPAFLSFRKVPDPVRKTRWQVGQWQNGQFVPLDGVGFQYVPLHPMPGEMRGRPIVSPALFTAIFLLTLLHDLRRVVANQGYPRIDIAVDFDKLQQVMPTEIQNDPLQIKAWADEIIAAVRRVYSQLQPDDTYVHSSVLTVNKPVGALNATSLGAIDGLFKALERMLTRALKSMPMLMATTDGVSEANSNRQWEIYSKQCQVLQHMIEGMLETQFDLALIAQGIPAKTVFRFSEIRAAEEQRDAQTLKQKLDNAEQSLRLGFNNQDEACMYALNKKPALPAPLSLKSGSAPSPDPLVPDPGSNRTAPPAPSNNGNGHHRSPSIAQIEAGVNFWAARAPEEARDLPFAEGAS